MSATPAALRVNFDQQGTWLLLRPTWLQHAGTWTQLGATSLRVEVHMASKWITCPAQCEILKPSVSLVFPIVFCYWWRFVWCNVPHVMSPLGPTWCEAVAKGLGPNFNLTWQIGADLGSSWVQDNTTCAQVEPNPGQFCGLNATHWKLTCLPLFLTFFGFGEGFLQGHVAHIGPVLGPTSTSPPHKTKLRMLSRTCVQTCPSCAILYPSSWVQAGANWTEFGASYAQVGPK